MPLLLNCSCGKRLRVPDHSAGQRVRCPGCERALTVTSNHTPPPPVPSPRAAIQFTCVCGEQLRVKAEHAGRLTRCPECRTQLTVPDVEGPGTPVARTRIRSDRPPLPRPGRDEDDRPRRRDEEDDLPRRREDRRDRRDEDDRLRRDDDRPRRRDDDDERPRPRRKARRSRGSILPWVLVGSIALLLLLGGGGAAAAWWLLSRSPSDLAFVPADGQGLVSVRLADLWKVDSVQKGIRQARGLGGHMPDPSAEMEKATGLRPEEIERVTVVIKDAEKQHLWFVVSTVQPYDRKKLLGKLTNSREVKHEGKTYHVGGLGGAPVPPGGPGGFGGGFAGEPGPQSALYLAGSRVLIFGPEEGVKQCLTFAAGKKARGPLSDGIRRAEGKHHVVAAFSLQPGQTQQFKAALGPQMARYAGLLDVQSGTLVMDFGDTTTIEANVRYPSEGQASQAKKTIDDGLEKVRQQLEEQVKQPGMPPEAKRSADALKEVSKGLTVQQKGSDLTIRLSVRSQTLDGIVPQPPAGPGFPRQ